MAATIVEAKWFHHMPMYRQQDQFAGSGWTPRRSTLSNIVSQVDFVASPLVEFMTKLVQQDIGVGIDDTTCRMLLPNTIPAATRGRQESTTGGEDRRSRPARETTACWPRCGSTRACTRRLTTSSTFASHGIAMAPTISSVKAAAGCKEIALGKPSVVLHSDDRLEFVACWGHARRKVVEATTYRAECELLLGPFDTSSV